MPKKKPPRRAQTAGLVLHKINASSIVTIYSGLSSIHLRGEGRIFVGSDGARECKDISVNLVFDDLALEKLRKMVSR